MQMEEKKTEQKIYVFQSLNIQGEKNPFKKTSFTINDTGDQLRSMACNLGKRTYVLMHDNSLASHPPCTSLSLSLPGNNISSVGYLSLSIFLFKFIILCMTLQFPKPPPSHNHSLFGPSIF